MFTKFFFDEGDFQVCIKKCVIRTELYFREPKLFDKVNNMQHVLSCSCKFGHCT